MAEISLKKELSGSILDLGGGGEGIVGRVYGSAVTAIDNRQEELDEAPKGPEKLPMDACDLKFDDGSFDNVTAFYFFMYLLKERHEDALAEAFRVLRPTGRLYVWDAEIKKADPFLVELDIDANGERVHTTYGVYKDDARQDAQSLAKAARSAGFSPVFSRIEDEDGQFRLCFEKQGD